MALERLGHADPVIVAADLVATHPHGKAEVPLPHGEIAVLPLEIVIDPAPWLLLAGGRDGLPIGEEPAPVFDEVGLGQGPGLILGEGSAGGIFKDAVHIGNDVTPGGEVGGKLFFLQRAEPAGVPVIDGQVLAADEFIGFGHAKGLLEVHRSAPIVLQGQGEFVVPEVVALALEVVPGALGDLGAGEIEVDGGGGEGLVVEGEKEEQAEHAKGGDDEFKPPGGRFVG